MQSDGAWTDTHCNHHNYVACYTDISTSGQKQYHVVEQNMTWEQAKVYCREHYKDLAMIETEEENSKVLTEVMSNVWIGLYRIPWRWSDGSNSTFKHWQAGKPNSHNNNEHCTVELSNHVWNDKYCYSKYAFICQEDLQKVRKSMVKMKISTEGDFSDAAVLQQALLTSYNKTGFKMEWMIKFKEEEEEQQNNKEENDIQCDQ
ncbi:C-type lectin lectoxin-Thr1-like [Salarias fasciatus]|uniref:C-type lectin lectoxin-Thr1-like n=1 Tax=Salarias fasciatus TaxID=181472 RepID=UPI001176624C|nr:C-type lectin lectoxin-Thr1-like [Salarias fasciatus]